MRAAIVAVGTELVADGRTDTNGVLLGIMLAAEGVQTCLRLIVEDGEEEIAAAMLDAARRFPLVIVTGGLGPTVDDVTREAAARAFGRPLREDPAALETIRARFLTRGRRFPPVAARQALVPEGATILPNAAGTAPGLMLSTGPGGVLVLLPGVPHEMELMMRDQALPRLRSLGCLPSGAEGVPFARRAMKIGGMTESQVQERIIDLFPSPAGGGPGGVSLTLLASPGDVSVIVRGRAPAPVDEAFEAARGRLGAHVFSEDLRVHLEEAVGDLLRRSGRTIAVAESCTGGLLGSLITSVAGSSRWFLQGWVTYSDGSKTAALGIPADLIALHGAVSEPVAEAMASAARHLSGADIGVGITGIAGPEGGSDEKPVGLVYIALADASGCRATRHQFGGDRETIRLFAARSALNRVRMEAVAR